MEREELIQSARKLYNSPWPNDALKKALEENYPELKESEDERIRKFLVKHVSEWIGCIEHDLKISSKDVESEEELAMFKAGLAYLEKQKNLFGSGRGLYYYDGEKTTTYFGYPTSEENLCDFVMSQQEKQKEQKPVERVEINKSLSDAVITELGKYNGENYWKSPWAIDSTGLQYPLYFANLGAKWQKEQKPIKVLYIPKFRDGDMVVSTKNPRLTYQILDVGNINELGNPEYKVEIFTDGKSDEPRNIKYIEVAKMDDWGKLIEQQPAEWSEEDEKMIERLTRILELGSKGFHADYTKEGYAEAYSWLKSLRPPQYCENCKLKRSVENWKPSEEQMKTLQYLCEQSSHPNPEVMPVLESLYNDLKKLM